MTRELVALILRRDRLRLAVWIVLSALLPIGVAAGSARAYPTQADRDAFAAAANVNPAELATRGPVFAPTVGGLTSWTVAASGAVLLGGVISLLFVIRHTRADEQAGRRELVGACAVSRGAPLTAALLATGGGNLVIGVLVALVLVAFGLPVPGAIALGLVYTLAGALFAGLGALCAQVPEGAGAARGLGLFVTAAMFAAAAVGEVSRSWLVWTTPFGWARRVQAFAGERWWVLLLFAGSAAALTGAAFALAARRDVGAGLVPTRSGPATAGRGMRSPLALAWRLHGASIVAWTVGAALLGLLLGAAMAALGDQLDTPLFRALGAGDPAQVFFRFVLYVLAQAVTAGAVAAALRMRGQEEAGLVDLLLAGPVDRLRWASGHIVVTAVGVVVALAGLGMGAGLGYGTPFGIVGTTLAYTPACLAITAVAVALYGWAPALAAPVAWTVLGLALVMDLLGEFRLVGEPVLALSPFVLTLRPLTSGAGLAPALAGLTAIAAALVVAGLVGLHRRDIAGQ